MKLTKKGKFKVVRAKIGKQVARPEQAAALTQVSLDWRFTHPGWAKISGLKPKLRKAAQAAVLAAVSGKTSSDRPAFSVSVFCGTDVDIKAINRDFRGIAKPTNVLSFPQFAPATLKRLLRDEEDSIEAVFLGDIAFGYQYIVAESKNDHKILINHLSHLMIHAILHLFGYDHMNDGQANRMERLETNIMQGLGLPDPYAEAEDIVPAKKPKKAAGKRG